MNHDGILIGQRDPALLESSVEEIRSLVDDLQDVGFRAIYTSDLRRARQTAEILQEALGEKIPLFLEEDLREAAYGELEGRSKEDVERDHPGFREDPEFAAPGGESFRQLCHRVEHFLKNIPDEHDPALIVAHSGVIRALKALFYEIPFEEAIRRRLGHDVILHCSEEEGERVAALITGSVQR